MSENCIHCVFGNFVWIRQQTVYMSNAQCEHHCSKHEGRYRYKIRILHARDYRTHLAAPGQEFVYNVFTLGRQYIDPVSLSPYDRLPEMNHENRRFGAHVSPLDIRNPRRFDKLPELLVPIVARIEVR
jgi:hypothetical protein